MPKFSNRSKERLATAEQPLQDLFNKVIQYVDCTILEGHRGADRQNQLYQEGKTKVRFPNSKHNSTPSRAVDVVPYPIDWGDIERFNCFANFVKGVAVGMDIKIKWGGDFKGFYDAPHYQLED